MGIVPAFANATCKCFCGSKSAGDLQPALSNILLGMRRLLHSVAAERETATGSGEAAGKKLGTEQSEPAPQEDAAGVAAFHEMLRAQVEGELPGLLIAVAYPERIAKAQSHSNRYTKA